MMFPQYISKFVDLQTKQDISFGHSVLDKMLDNDALLLLLSIIMIINNFFPRIFFSSIQFFFISFCVLGQTHSSMRKYNLYCVNLKCLK